MRIIAGTHGGRRLHTPAGTAVRPTADRVREALFSSLAPVVADAVVLDLYAGSGALGIEALSRGAWHVVFVERAPAVAAVLRDNLRRLDLSAEVATCAVQAWAEGRCTARAVGRPAGAGRPAADLVLADPPYADDLDELTAALAVLRSTGRLAAGADVVVERDRRRDDRLPAWLHLRRRRAYGDTVLLYLRVGDPAGAVTGDRP